jgi:2-C-methyl-D-erythritol 4-phosphate cytidylyltransferase/2-C-methyl-D-erythritol 2,4-cyclodiphosphate synthase
LNRVGAVIVAAGRGTRMGAPANKVLLPLQGQPVLTWSVRAFAEGATITEIVVVAHPEETAAVSALLETAAVAKVAGVVPGGAERGDSVRAGLAALPPAVAHVAVHDGARPLVSPRLIAACVEAAREHGAAVPALPALDTLKRASPDGAFRETVDRRDLFAVQTPQVFRRDWLEAAYARAAADAYSGTDDAALVERLGHPVRRVAGERANVKITLPEDLELAAALLARRSPVEAARMTATGYGYDVHPLEPGRRLVLGGVEIAHTHGLRGHSDADVLTHALCDALLGAAGLEDIGVLFPDTDDRYRGISSLVLLEEVARRLRDAGCRFLHADLTLVAEAPRIRPHVPDMRANLARALACAPDQINVKATTSEGLGFVGRGEGMVAHAVATVAKSG